MAKDKSYKELCKENNIPYTEPANNASLFGFIVFALFCLLGFDILRRLGIKDYILMVEIIALFGILLLFIAMIYGQVKRK